MQVFTFTVKVVAESPAEAERVMVERLGPDEDYGFAYTIEWEFES